MGNWSWVIGHGELVIKPISQSPRLPISPSPNLPVSQSPRLPVSQSLVPSHHYPFSDNNRS